MTIRQGEKTVIESLSQFQARLDVSNDEIAQALPEETRERMLAEENALRSANGDPPVEDPTEVHDDILHQVVQDRGVNTVIIDVLEARDREYIHLFDGTVQRIVELYPTDDEVLP